MIFLFRRATRPARFVEVGNVYCFEEKTGSHILGRVTYVGRTCEAQSLATGALFSFLPEHAHEVHHEASH